MSNDRPTEHRCGYNDHVPGRVVWRGDRGKCQRCGAQLEAPEPVEGNG